MNKPMTKHMTFGEMKTWTERFNQIIGASQINVNKRLDVMIEDICTVYGYNNKDKYVVNLFNMVWESRYGVSLYDAEREGGILC